MKIDSRLNSKARLKYRILSFILSVVFLIMGFLAIIEKTGEGQIKYDSTFKFGVAAVGWGVIFLVVAIRGRLFKKRF